MRIIGTDEYGNARRVTGRLTDVHKPLVSASLVCKNGKLDSWITSVNEYGQSGYLIPRNGPIAEGLRKSFTALTARHGYSTLIPLYEENGVYNFYVKKQRCEAVQSLDKSLSIGASDNRSGNVRQVNP